jgi:hypothetical protein
LLSMGNVEYNNRNARSHFASKSIDMATAGQELGAVRIIEASESEALEALNYTCEYYLQMSADQFIKLWDAGEISPRDVEQNSGLSYAIDMLSLLRP